MKSLILILTIVAGPALAQQTYTEAPPAVLAATAAASDAVYVLPVLLLVAFGALLLGRD